MDVGEGRILIRAWRIVASFRIRDIAARRKPASRETTRLAFEETAQWHESTNETTYVRRPLQQNYKKAENKRQ